MLVGEQAGDRQPPDPVQRSQAHQHAEPAQRRRRQHVVDASRRQCGGHPEARGHRVESSCSIERHVLTGVDQIETSDPHGQREPEHEGRRIEALTHRHPAARGRDAIGESEDPVRRPGDVLRVGVAHEKDERERRQLEAERIQHPRRHEHERGAGGGQRGELAGSQQSSWQVAPGRARILRVDDAIDHAVGGHRARPRPRHRRRDPRHGPPARPAAGRQHHGDVGKRQREDRVLELDGVDEVAELGAAGAQSP